MKMFFPSPFSIAWICLTYEQIEGILSSSFFSENRLFNDLSRWRINQYISAVKGTCPSTVLMIFFAKVFEVVLLFVGIFYLLNLPF